MSNRLSITTGVTSLITVCIGVGLQLAECAENASSFNSTVNGLLSDIEGLTAVSESMLKTLRQSEIEELSHATGHIGNHCGNIAQSLLDCETTLFQLQEKLWPIRISALSIKDAQKERRSPGTPDQNKQLGIDIRTSQVLRRDLVREVSHNQLRYQQTANQIAHYRHKVQAYRDAFQLSLQTLILWNQANCRASAEDILPNLNDLHKEVRRIAANVDSLIKVIIGENTNNSELDAVINLKKCVRSSNTVISSASTIITRGPGSISYGSEYGDEFSAERSEHVNRWIEFNPIYEAEEPRGTDLQSLKSTNAGVDILDTLAHDSADSDSELEAEITVAMLNYGKRKLRSHDWPSAERLFRNCLLRIPQSSRNPKPSASTKCRVSRHEALGLLVETHMQQENWSEAQSALLEKLSITSTLTSDVGPSVRSADLLLMASIVLKKDNYIEANLYARRALKESRKQGDAGVDDVRQALLILAEICRHEEKVDEEEAYEALLANLPVQNTDLTSPDASQGRVFHEVSVTPAETFSVEDKPKPALDLTEASTLDIMQQSVQRVTLNQAPFQPTADIVKGKKLNSEDGLDSDGKSSSGSIVVDDRQRMFDISVKGSLGASPTWTSDERGQIFGHRATVVGKVETGESGPTNHTITALNPESVTELEGSCKTVEAARISRVYALDCEQPYEPAPSGPTGMTPDPAAVLPMIQQPALGMAIVRPKTPVPEASQRWTGGNDVQHFETTGATQRAWISLDSSDHKQSSPVKDLGDITAHEASGYDASQSLPGSNDVHSLINRLLSLDLDLDLKILPICEPQPFSRKVIIVGDSFTGKTSLVTTQAHSKVYSRTRPIEFNMFNSTVTVYGERINLVLCDTSGDDDYWHRRVRANTYYGAQVVLLLYSIAHPDSLDNIWERWAPEVFHFLPKSPRLLVGTFSDLRKDGETVAKLLKTKQHPVTTAEGEEIARRIDAKYFECSAKFGTGIAPIFEYAARIALPPPEPWLKSLFRRYFK